MVREPPRRAPRWSKKTDQLVAYVASTCRPALQSELGSWISSSPRFEAFVAANQDKVRKKFTTAQDAEARFDVRAELRVAYLLLADRRFDVQFEAYGARRVGPDLSVTYRTVQRFNIEVTRFRATADSDFVPGGGDVPDATALGSGAGSPSTEHVGATVEPPRNAGGLADKLSDAADEPGQHPGSGGDRVSHELHTDSARLSNVIATKVRQLPAEVPNVLLIVVRGLGIDEGSLRWATAVLKSRVGSRDDAFFARRGLKDARDFHAHFVRLSGVFVLDEASVPQRASFWANREARHALSSEALAQLTQCMGLAGAAAQR